MASSLRLGDLTLGEQAKPNGGNIDPPTMDTTKDNSSHDKAADELEWLSQSDYREVVGYPTWAWKKLNDVCPGKVQVKRVNERSLSSSGKCPPDTVRFVCISDTHSVSHNIDVPEGDVLIHAGDFTMEGRRFEVDSFVEFLRSLPHRHKIVIAGNHDLPFDPKTHKRFADYFGDRDDKDCKVCLDKLKEICTYLQDSAMEVEGYRVYGSPWQPVHARWAFTLDRGAKLREKWKLIPQEVDILVTHGPPLGYGDRVSGGERAGCLDLLDEVKHRIKPKYHIYGHIHEGYGVTTDGTTVFINASICNSRYKPKHKPIVLDLPRRVKPL